MSSVDFTIYQGDSRTLTITVKDQNNVAVNITGSNIKWVLVNSNTTLIYKDNQPSNGITITNATGGQCSLLIAAADTSNLAAGSYGHEARLIDNAGNSSIIFTGVITVKASNV